MKIVLFKDGTGIFADSTEKIADKDFTMLFDGVEVGTLYIGESNFPVKGSKAEVKTNGLASGINIVKVISNGKKYYCESIARNNGILSPTGIGLREVVKNKMRIEILENEMSTLREEMKNLNNIFLGVKL